MKNETIYKITQAYEFSEEVFIHTETQIYIIHCKEGLLSVSTNGFGFNNNPLKIEDVDYLSNKLRLYFSDLIATFNFGGEYTITKCLGR